MPMNRTSSKQSVKITLSWIIFLYIADAEARFAAYGRSVTEVVVPVSRHRRIDQAFSIKKQIFNVCATFDNRRMHFSNYLRPIPAT